ncbi:S8 family serine peptidase [Marinobacter nauticus]|uniref:Peptidase S8/S53 domain-containing protein n=1 Tax=Marinobacter nauticus TaxID=2743 RepID=A0A1M2UXE6_MARNT|nr:S8 family serine peptidase [Marinobacter nauticus]OJT00005.1 hypothetical protein BEE62_07795 [Marinobacter nauticus]
MNYITRKHLLGSLILAATLGTASHTHAMSLLSPQASDDNAKAVAPAVLPGSQSDTVVLMILREGINDTIERENRRVPASEADAIMAELLADPATISVEKAGIVTTPPITQPGDQGNVSAQSAMDTFAQSQARGPLKYNDPLYANQEWFDPTQEHGLRLEPALERLSFDRTIRVGVIDGGFESSVDLQYAEGVNLISEEPTRNPKGPLFLNEDVDCSYNGEVEISQHGHHVSHLIAANVDNALGMSGVTANVELVAARSMFCGGAGLTSDIVDGIYWLSGEPVDGVDPISQPVEIINMSLGEERTCPIAYQTAINVAHSKGIIIVAAAGNDRTDANKFAPANCDNVITVAAHDTRGILSNFTNTGANVDTVAQGSLVTSITPEGNPTTVGGTSFSTPIVAGVIANVLSERPGLSTAQLKAMIAESGNPVVEASFRPNLGAGSGILDAMKFLDAAGIPRAIVAAQSALQGERERFVEALNHPLAQNLLNVEVGGDACSLIEIDGNVLPNANPNDPLMVFAVPAGAPLSPTASNANVLAQTEAGRMIVSTDTLDAFSNSQFGIARCDVTTGSNCNQVDTIRGFNLADLERPAFCTVAMR